MMDAGQASFVCDFIECLNCSNGEPFRLMDWQRDAVTEFYGEMIEDEDAAGSYIRRYQYLYPITICIKALAPIGIDKTTINANPYKLRNNTPIAIIMTIFDNKLKI